MLAPRYHVPSWATRGGHIDSDVLTEDGARRTGNLKGLRQPVSLRLLEGDTLTSPERGTRGVLFEVRPDWRS